MSDKEGNQMDEQISFVKAAQDFFTKEPHGRKVEIPEFKALTDRDKAELRDMLVGVGYNVAPLGVTSAQLQKAA